MARARSRSPARNRARTPSRKTAKAAASSDVPWCKNAGSLLFFSQGIYFFFMISMMFNWTGLYKGFGVDVPDDASTADLRYMASIAAAQMFLFMGAINMIRRNDDADTTANACFAFMVISALLGANIFLCIVPNMEGLGYDVSSTKGFGAFQFAMGACFYMAWKEAGAVVPAFNPTPEGTTGWVLRATHAGWITMAVLIKFNIFGAFSQFGESPHALTQQQFEDIGMTAFLAAVLGECITAAGNADTTYGWLRVATFCMFMVLGSVFARGGEVGNPFYGIPVLGEKTAYLVNFFGMVFVLAKRLVAEDESMKYPNKSNGEFSVKDLNPSGFGTARFGGALAYYMWLFFAIGMMLAPEGMYDAFNLDFDKPGVDATSLLYVTRVEGLQMAMLSVIVGVAFRLGDTKAQAMSCLGLAVAIAVNMIPLKTLWLPELEARNQDTTVLLAVNAVWLVIAAVCFMGWQKSGSPMPTFELMPKDGCASIMRVCHLGYAFMAYNLFFNNAAAAEQYVGLSENSWTAVQLKHVAILAINCCILGESLIAGGHKGALYAYARASAMICSCLFAMKIAGGAGLNANYGTPFAAADTYVFFLITMAQGQAVFQADSAAGFNGPKVAAGKGSSITEKLQSLDFLFATTKWMSIFWMTLMFFAQEKLFASFDLDFANQGSDPISFIMVVYGFQMMLSGMLAGIAARFGNAAAQSNLAFAFAVFYFVVVADVFIRYPNPNNNMKIMTVVHAILGVCYFLAWKKEGGAIPAWDMSLFPGGFGSIGGTLRFMHLGFLFMGFQMTWMCDGQIAAQYGTVSNDTAMMYFSVGRTVFMHVLAGEAIIASGHEGSIYTYGRAVGIVMIAFLGMKLVDNRMNGNAGTPLAAYDVHLMFAMGYLLWKRILDTDEAKGTFA